MHPVFEFCKQHNCHICMKWQFFYTLSMESAGKLAYNITEDDISEITPIDVYIVIKEDEHRNDHVLGVFLNKELAQQAVNTMPRKEKELVYFYPEKLVDSIYYHITEAKFNDKG